MLAKIHVTFKNGVLDPQGKAVQMALNNLGYKGVREVRVGKYMEIRLDADSEDEARTQVREMCEKLLANTVIESYDFTLSPEE